MEPAVSRDAVETLDLLVFPDDFYVPALGEQVENALFSAGNIHDVRIRYGGLSAADNG